MPILTKLIDVSILFSCMYKALEQHMMNSSQCVVPWILSQKPICTEKKAINETFWIAWNRYWKFNLYYLMFEYIQCTGHQFYDKPRYYAEKSEDPILI